MDNEKSSKNELALSESPPGAMQLHNGKLDVGSMMLKALEYLQGPNAVQAVEALERLTALHHVEQDRQAKRAFFEALAAFQAECPPIEKSRTAGDATQGGRGYHYTYAPLEGIIKVIRPVLNKHGLSFSWDSQTVDGEIATTCTVRHVDGHSLSATCRVPLDTNIRGTAPQKSGSSHTYSMRYSLTQALGLRATDDDNDGAGDAAPESNEPINEDELADLGALMQEVNQNVPRFLKHFGIERLADLPKSRLNEAVNGLQRKRKK